MLEFIAFGKKLICIGIIINIYIVAFFLSFWRFGKQEEIVIDDRLHNVEAKFVLMREPKYEFWQPLAEKAYAKFLKSYEAIKEVPLNDMFVDLSGCIVESYSVDEAPADLFKIIVKSIERGSHVGISVCGNSLSPATLFAKALSAMLIPLPELTPFKSILTIKQFNW